MRVRLKYLKSAPLALLPGNDGLHPRKGGPGAKGLKWFEMNVAAAALPLTHKRSSEPTLPPGQTELKRNK